jgi:pimeloyl-ACP methyl ester carboxylesterase
MTDCLELLHEAPSRPLDAPPLLFLHGAYVGAWCWQEHFLPWFAAQGFDAWALSLRGHGGSRTSRPRDTLSIDDYVDDVLRAQERLPAEPILIGHSMGGFVAQKALERHPFPAIVLLCSVPPTGLAGSLLHMLLSSPLALLEMNLFMTGKRKPHRSLVEALFHHLPPEADLARYLAASGPESLRAIWDMMGFSRIDRTRQHPAPVHVFGAEHDKIIPPDQVETTARFYGTTARILPEFGHTLMLEPGWERAAQAIAQVLQPAAQAA